MGYNKMAESLKEGDFMADIERIKIISVDSLLQLNLEIPDYQRAYKWKVQNISDLLSDISNAINEEKRYNSDFKYRIGTIILHKTESGVLEVVDGQQRIISMILIKLCLDPYWSCTILNKKFTNKVSQFNIHRNSEFINEWFSMKSNDKTTFQDAYSKILEVVVITVEKMSEAFQLFDSQNTRGKELDPHDLLKAYHLREMKEHPYEMEHAVTKWEAQNVDHIRELFDQYLFPIWNWSRGLKTRPFTTKDIDTYKGISESSTYTYAKRANKAMPYFQISEPFIAGNDFFEMVDHYMKLLHDIKSEICQNEKFKSIKSVLCGEFNLKQEIDVHTPEELDKLKFDSAGFKYTRNLYFCVLLYYYDKFHNFDEMAVKKLFTWTFMLRVDMENLGADSINKYAIGNENSKYTNTIPMFSKISHARTHNEIADLYIKIYRENNTQVKQKWNELYEAIKRINGTGGNHER